MKFRIDIEFGWEIIDVEAKSKRDAIEKAEIPTGLVFSIRQIKKEKSNIRRNE